MELVHLGHAGHFIASNSCTFHLTTIVGDYLVSTVGEWRPDREGDMQQIGVGRYYETMVFAIGEERHPCGCPKDVNTEEVDMWGYEAAEAAQMGHRIAIEKWMNPKRVFEKRREEDGTTR